LGLAASLIVLAGVANLGCAKKVFSEREPRTQYEQYDRLHGTHAPPPITDRNGDKRPALRQRLSPPRN